MDNILLVLCRAHYFKITSSFGSVPFWMLVLISSAISPTLTMLQAHQINHLAEGGMEFCQKGSFGCCVSVTYGFNLLCHQSCF